MICPPAGTTRWSRFMSLMNASSVWLTGLNSPHARKAHSKQLNAHGGIDAYLPAQGILQTANRVLHLAFDLIGFAFAFQLLVSDGFPGPFLHFALGPARRSLRCDLCRSFYTS